MLNSRFISLTLIVTAAACSEPNGVNVPTRGPAPLMHKFGVLPAAPILGIDKEFADLQKQLGTFAGAYVFGDTLVVRVTDEKDSEAALLMAREWISGRAIVTTTKGYYAQITRGTS